MNKVLLFISISFIACCSALGQNKSAKKQWETTSCDKSELCSAYENVEKYDVLEFDNESYKLRLNDGETVLINIPVSATYSETFEVSNSNVMPPELAAKFPEIYSFTGKSLSDSKRHIKLDINYSGFHAMVSDGTQRIFIDPIKQGDKRSIIYSDRDFKPSDAKEIVSRNMKCTHVHHTNLTGHKQEPVFIDTPPSSERKGVVANKSTDGFLYVYRLALTCTGEYAAYHGGTKASVMSAMTTSINRVNEVYNRDLSVKLEFIANNDELIFLNANTDGFTNTDVFLDELAPRINQLIGEENYDLSHGFSTDAGGVAYLASVCEKDFVSGGVTGVTNPEGDAFDIDFVAHEIGHQFNGEHTFNGTKGSCSGNQSSATNWEPGSGSTIMGYAGICGSDNLQDNSDPYFHGGNLNDMIQFIQEDATCATKIATGNVLPSLSIVSPMDLTIPISTPFELEGLSDNSDDITYCWEQNDHGGRTGAPTQQAGDAPIFRSYNPTPNSVRYFPRLSDLLNGTTTKGEMLPEYTRELNFKLTVRDNKANGGGVIDKDYVLDVSGESGPFIVTSQSTANSTVEVGGQLTITWDVANTNIAPVSCSEVEIYLSTDGGNNFDVLLATTENDGSHKVEIPNSITTKARVKVKAANNVFFNVNDIDFSIVTPTVPTFAFNYTIDNHTICGSETSLLTLETTAFVGFSDQINLSYTIPSGIILNNTSPTIDSDGSLILGVELSDEIENGFFTIRIDAVSGNITKSVEVDVVVVRSVENETIALNIPFDSEIIDALSPKIKWSANSVFNSYKLSLSESADFNSLLLNELQIGKEYSVPFTLEPSSTYFWKVEATDVCGNTILSDVSSFTTPSLVCQSFSSLDVPVFLSDGQSNFESELIIALDKKIIDLNVTLKGTHEYTDDILVYLESDLEDKEQVYLFGNVCSGGFGEDLDLTLDDESTLGNAPCPPSDGGIYTPEESLSYFHGQTTQGTWKLLIVDQYPSIDEGVLESWSIEFCYASLEGTPFLSRNYVFANEEVVLITSSEIAANDLDGDNSKVIFTILNDTYLGSFYNETIQLNTGDEFSQEDIDLGNITFEIGDSLESAEELYVKLTDEDDMVSSSIALNFDFSGITGLRSVDLKSGLIVYPNPTTGLVYLESEANWILINSFGVELESGFGKELDLTNYTTGVYLVKTLEGSVKVIKNK